MYQVLKRHPYRTLVVVFVLIASLVLLVLWQLQARMPEVIGETFTNSQSANNFTTVGNGNWAVKDGVYELATSMTAGSNAPGNVALSLYNTPVTVSNWRLTTNAKVLNTGNIHDFSLVFDYIDEANYFYANFSDKADANSNGLFQIADGKQKKLAGFPSPIVTNRVYEIEIRKEDGKVKVYRESQTEKKTFMATAKTKNYTSMRVGYGSRGGAAVFDNLVVNGSGSVTKPDPTPSPEPKPDPKPTPNPTPNPGPVPAPTPPASSTPIPGGGRLVSVVNSPQLSSAIRDAKPGDVIRLADGTYDGSIIDEKGKSKKSSMKIGEYTGSYAVSTPGTKEKPITLEGSSKAIIDGTGTGAHYGLYLAGAHYWQVKGITVTNATKGIVVDRSNHVTIESVDVHSLGQEGIHYRQNSSDGLIKNNRVWDTGLKNATYGEGIYIGSANSNWGRYNGGQPDRADRNQVIGNVISRTGAESMDIKEGTTGGLIEGNTFDGAGMTGSWADSWIDMKGNDWTVRGNTGKNAKQDGFQVHGALKGWGNGNVFSQNTAIVNAAGYGFWLQNNVSGNIISCDNIVKQASSGYATTACQP